MEVNAGDTAWVLAASALVLFMTPGLAFFYGGMVRGKNVLGMLMQNFFAMGLIGVLWAVVGFSLAFGDGGGFVGNFDFAFMKDINVTDADGALVNNLPGLDFLTIPPIIFFAFQMMFAIITPALITGATADRLKFKSLRRRHRASGRCWCTRRSPTGCSARPAGSSSGARSTSPAARPSTSTPASRRSVIVAIIGKRKGYPEHPMPPHNLPFTLLGTGILWFGWFGFNAGSAAAANNQAAQAFVNTGLAASAAMLGWLVVEKIKDGHATTLGGASGAVAGLVAITPCAGYVGGMSPIYIGAIAGVVCYLAISIKKALKLDDSLDVIAVHLVGGIVGSLLLGLLRRPVRHAATASTACSSAAAPTCWSTRPSRSASALVYSAVVTFIIAKGVDLILGLRVDEDAEDTGLDLSQHAETAYSN